jgi:hypothetical protein
VLVKIFHDTISNNLQKNQTSHGGRGQNISEKLLSLSFSAKKKSQGPAANPTVTKAEKQRTEEKDPKGQVSQVVRIT